MDLTLAHFTEGKKMLKRALSKKPFKKYPGDSVAICRQIVDECWNGNYFQVSTGHFDSFYMRDFAFCADALVKLGYRHEVTTTLHWALEIYEKWDVLTTTITTDKKPIHVFDYASDTLPLLLRTIRITKAKFLANQFKDFINKQIRYYYDNVLDKQLGLVDPNKSFSSMRDHYNRKSCMYDNSMMAMIPIELEHLRKMGIKLVDPFRKWNFSKVIRDRFWVGTHFLDDLTHDHHIATDANVFPYYCGIFNDSKMIWDSVMMIKKYKLDKPIPAKYTEKQHKSKEMFPINMLAPNYEGDTCWAMLGLLFLYVIRMISKHMVDYYLDVFSEAIEKYGTFLELYDAKGKPYKKTFYKTDEGMLWAAMYLDLYLNK
ncbi:MAG: hypothetical protein ACLFPQ_02495 [Candidatus Woesearchaeota archaeon]